MDGYIVHICVTQHDFELNNINIVKSKVCFTQIQLNYLSSRASTLYNAQTLMLFINFSCFKDQYIQDILILTQKITIIYYFM